MVCSCWGKFGLQLLGEVWFAAVGGSLVCSCWGKFGLQLMGEVWSAPVGRSLVCSCWGNFGLQLLGEVWFAAVGGSWVCSWWGKFGLQLLGEVWFAAVGGSLVCSCWGKFGLQLLGEVWFAAVGGSLVCSCWGKFGLQLMGEVWFAAVGGSLVCSCWGKFGLQLLGEVGLQLLGEVGLQLLGEVCLHMFNKGLTGLQLCVESGNCQAGAAAVEGLGSRDRQSRNYLQRSIALWEDWGGGAHFNKFIPLAGRIKGIIGLLLGFVWVVALGPIGVALSPSSGWAGGDVCSPCISLLLRTPCQADSTALTHPFVTPTKPCVRLTIVYTTGNQRSLCREDHNAVFCVLRVTLCCCIILCG